MNRQVRSPAATAFYPQDPGVCGETVRRFADRVSLPDTLPERILGGIVPHAGWVYSGSCAAHLYAALARASTRPEVVVLLGAVHDPGVRRAAVSGHRAWRSPLGEVPVDEALAAELLRVGGGALERSAEAHEHEHSIEVQVPFVQRLLPGASVLPVAVPADERAVDVGGLLAEALRRDGRGVAVVASTDLTHYGERYGFAPAGTGQVALDFARANDQGFLQRVIELDAPGALEHARAHHSACGAGAVAALISLGVELGSAGGHLLCHTSSWDVRPQGMAHMFVGYGSVAL